MWWGGLAHMAWVCGPPLRPVDHSHLANYTLMWSSSSCTVQAHLSRLTDLSVVGWKVFLLPINWLPALLHAASYPQRCLGRLFTSMTFLTGELAARNSLHPKKYFWKALGDFFIVNISVNTFFFYLNFFLPTVKTSYYASLQSKTRWKTIIMTYIRSI